MQWRHDAIKFECWILFSTAGNQFWWVTEPDYFVIMTWHGAGRGTRLEAAAVLVHAGESCGTYLRRGRSRKTLGIWDDEEGNLIHFDVIWTSSKFQNYSRGKDGKGWRLNAQAKSCYTFQLAVLLVYLSHFTIAINSFSLFSPFPRKYKLLFHVRPVGVARKCGEHSQPHTFPHEHNNVGFQFGENDVFIYIFE